MEQIINEYDERVKQGLLFEKKELPKIFEGAVKDYEERLAQCETDKEKEDLRLEILRRKKKDRKKFSGLAAGYKWAKIKGGPIFFTNYGTLLELRVFFSGVIDYKMELYMEGNKNKNRPTRFEALIQLYKEKGERSRTQLMQFAEKHGYASKSFADFYTKNFNQIKKESDKLK